MLYDAINAKTNISIVSLSIMASGPNWDAFQNAQRIPWELISRICLPIRPAHLVYIYNLIAALGDRTNRTRKNAPSATVSVDLIGGRPRRALVLTHSLASYSTETAELVVCPRNTTYFQWFPEPYSIMVAT
jgi:hypothetical protein